MRRSSENQRQPSDRAVSVFISYSHDSPEHSAWVAQLANRLRKDGIDARIDQFVGDPDEGWPRWMHRGLVGSDYILCVCTETYRNRFENIGVADGVGRGVIFEGGLIYDMIYEWRGKNPRIRAVVPDGGSTDDIPGILKPPQHYLIDADYAKLLEFLDPAYESKPELPECAILSDGVPDNIDSGIRRPRMLRPMVSVAAGLCAAASVIRWVPGTVAPKTKLVVAAALACTIAFLAFAKSRPLIWAVAALDRRWRRAIYGVVGFAIVVALTAGLRDGYWLLQKHLYQKDIRNYLSSNDFSRLSDAFHRFPHRLECKVLFEKRIHASRYTGTVSRRELVDQFMEEERMKKLLGDLARLRPARIIEGSYATAPRNDPVHWLALIGIEGKIENFDRNFTRAKTMMAANEDRNTLSKFCGALMEVSPDPPQTSEADAIEALIKEWENAPEVFATSYELQIARDSQARVHASRNELAEELDAIDDLLTIRGEGAVRASDLLGEFAWLRPPEKLLTYWYFGLAYDFIKEKELPKLYREKLTQRVADGQYVAALRARFENKHTEFQTKQGWRRGSCLDVPTGEIRELLTQNWRW